MKVLLLLIFIHLSIISYSLEVIDYRFATGVEYSEKKVDIFDGRSSELKWTLAKGSVYYEDKWDTYFNIKRINVFDKEHLQDHEENEWEIYLRHRKKFERREILGNSWRPSISFFADVQQEEIEKDKEYEIGVRGDAGSWINKKNYLRFTGGGSYNYEEDYRKSEEHYYKVFLEFLWRHNFNDNWFNIFQIQNDFNVGDKSGYSMDILDYIMYRKEFGKRSYFEMRHGIELSDFITSDSDLYDEQTLFSDFELGQKRAITEDWDIKYYIFYGIDYEMREWSKKYIVHEYGVGILFEYKWE